MKRRLHHVVLVGLPLLAGPTSSFAAERIKELRVAQIGNPSAMDCWNSTAQALGASGWRIVWAHILPNTLASILVVAGFQLGVLILLEATLSFLGLGIRPPTPAWGSMLSDARNYLSEAWWTVLFPGMAIFLIVMAANFLGDSLRDRLDPTLRGKP